MNTAAKRIIHTMDRSKVFCACGLSGTFPFCDSSHRISRTNEAGKLVGCGPQKQLAAADKESAELMA